MNLKQKWLAGSAVVLMGLGSTAYGSTLIGGNAADFNSATNILDIVFVIDTSGSMADNSLAISNTASAAITALNCPDDVWVRARFMGITNVEPGTIFDERMTTVLAGNALVSNSSEDNGPAVTDLSNFYPWFSGGEFDAPGNSTAGKTLYKAVVTIGDEGTENGQPVVQSDWDAALVANAAAIANDVFLFAWATDTTNALVAPLFQSMAEGGGPPVASFTGGNCSDTGGAFIDGTAGQTTAQVTATLQDIICTAGGGGTGGGGVPVPAPLALLGVGLLGLGLRRHFFA